MRQADAALHKAKRTGKSPAVLQGRRDPPQSVCGDGAG
ncbi:ribosomal protein L25 (general stress protein Ctc) [Azospirillum rugosum]|uniref:Ribosomal protein L25 (General stress protein Ctc) n=1 Tax=Azospirillum rugosum TaxID=416170 RepID=A0ABS4SK99_9PROT|nr:ribosomal protein L25 (general stress protein Ctc) [Azospirillum rugosum]MDQ0526532.1 ribosomal protein L25 (general stress protein Ctc) [Azospirillum rugosum]